MQSLSHPEWRKPGVTMENFTALFLAIAWKTGNQSHGKLARFLLGFSGDDVSFKKCLFNYLTLGYFLNLFFL
jgi:hypothetical protein